VAVGLLCVTLAAASLCASQDPVRCEFDSWAQRFEKTYATTEEAARRFAIFSQARLDVMALNAASAPGTATFALNALADLTDAEKSRLRGYRYNPNRVRKYEPVKKVMKAIPDDYDLRALNATTRVWNQLEHGNYQFCGNCYAIAATGALETTWFLSGSYNGTVVPLSISQATDCPGNGEGCENGGEVEDVFAYYLNKGSETESDYPYDNQDGSTHSCKAKSSKTVVTPSSWADVCSKDENCMQSTMIAQGPLGIAMYADAKAFDNYAGGVMTAKQCGYPGKKSSLDHALLLVGYNTTADTPYWIVKNSYGTDWGVAGYLYVTMGENTCGISEQVSYIQM